MRIALIAMSGIRGIPRARGWQHVCRQPVRQRLQRWCGGDRPGARCDAVTFARPHGLPFRRFIPRRCEPLPLKSKGEVFALSLEGEGIDQRIHSLVCSTDRGDRLACHHWVNAESEKWVLLAATGVFSVSRTFRTVDAAVCPHFAAGMHLRWHLLNPIVLYLCVRSLYAGGRAQLMGARAGRLA